jgi:hypothetical protein
MTKKWWGEAARGFLFTIRPFSGYYQAITHQTGES